MLGRITWDQFCEWMIYDTLEPFGEERADSRAAQIAQALWNIATARTKPGGWPLEHFRLHIGDWTPSAPAVEPQSVAQQERFLDTWIAGSNARFREGRHVRTA